MKNFYVLLMVFLVSIGMFAQSYYVLPYLDVGKNPRDLNNDREESPSEGWTNVMSTTTIPTWSAPQTIPFAFKFNGVVESSYVVSSTGVLTFASSPGVAPSASNLSIPSTMIPDKSVMVWGIELTGANDKIRTKTFGFAPNRQHWISWTSASHANFTGTPHPYGANWSIVLEETTNKIYIIDQKTYSRVTTANVAITAGIQVNSTDATAIAGQPSLGSRTFSTSIVGDDATDNTFYEFDVGTAPILDIAAEEEKVSGICLPNTPITIEAMFRNGGLTDVLSADFNYSVNGAATVTTAVSNLNMNSGSYQTATNPTPFIPTTDGIYEIEMWLSNLDGVSDPVPSNDKITAKIIVTSNPPNRKVFIEERTGTWCNWCPRGIVAMDYMALNHHEEAVLIAVHTRDILTVDNYNENIDLFGSPSFQVDRATSELGIANPQSMVDAMNTRRAVIPAASLEITNIDYTSGGSVQVDVESVFITDETRADYRYQLIFVEDSVTGTLGGYGTNGSRYDQGNHYANGAYGPMASHRFDFAASTQPVPASQMAYYDVARSLEPSWEGAAGSVPDTIIPNLKVNYTFITTLPDSVINPKHVRVVVLLLDHKKGGEVINANEKKLLTDTNGINLDELDMLEVNVYPNPVSDYINIALYENKDFSVELVNSIGQVVLTDSFTKTNFATINTSNLAKGVYLLKLNAGDQKSTMRIAITK